MRINVVLFTAGIIVSMFLVGATATEYDPWVDTNDDGKIDIFDVVDLVGHYGTAGIPINKTALLLELQHQMSLLNSSLVELEDRVAVLEQMLFTSALVAEWKFDEGSGLIAFDNSDKGNDGTIYGAEWIIGKSGSALYFDGVDDYVEVPDNASLDLIGNLTVEAWARVDEDTGDHQIIAGKWYPHQSYLLEFRPDGITPQLVLTGSLVISNITVPLGSWAHVVGTYDGSIARIYVNGTLAGNLPVSGPLVSGDSLLCIGSHSPVMPSDRNWFRGVIDEVRVYSRVLSELEIQAHYADE